ncbi:hypothetical protein METBIDRAFT_37079 [Metschnikowia bicuspidata var. bicuspidata NRRL YB-4993]|uniref:Nucleoporin Nup120/160 beta-propeller domain-containing protein n=1 Tax=Metschnikowia bicuspidata var. bicuspidata NRRL YB-4993 TaxID=869754 RepID=A0A1A0HGC0_9ASCO|nr:hypothetical protein METBIDRAFT_37079 [Metschnikowia bicuspidata var. bicuspidata NRRL YB-4993]OBA22927.1 hypothetical protein METBIDRAFT_37079 [Metschnikowia bicuspidata var. bicuspidata NRRL YB-4993]
MNPVTASHIVGYDSHLPIKHVKLPLKYLSGNPTKDFSDDFITSCFGHSEFIDISAQKGHFFTLIQTGITKDKKRLRLSPLIVDEATALGVQFQALEILLPHPIINKGTFTYHFVSLEKEEEPCIIIDILDESFLLMTFRIELSDFIMGNDRNRLVLDNFHEWVNISVPYSFELRSSPFFMKSLDPCNIIVSMNDGGILHFKRSEPLSSIDIYNFTDIAPLVSLNFIGSLFSGSGKSDGFMGGLSSNATVDVAQLSRDEFVTLSLNRCVKVYNINSHKQTDLCADFKGCKSLSEWLTNIPNKYFQKLKNSSSTSLHLMLPVDEIINSSGRPTYETVNWDITNGKLEHIERLKLDVDYSGPNIATDVEDHKSLRVQDFQIVAGEEELAYHVLYKANTYSEVAHYTQDKITGNISLIKTALPHQAPVFAELSNHRETEYYVSTVFNSGIFDKRIVSSALDVFIQNLENKPNLDGILSLRQKVTLTVTFVSTAEKISESSAWYKFALICLEFRRSSQEALSISAQRESVFCSEVNGVAVYRKAHSYEAGLHQHVDNSLTDLIRSLSSRFSVQTLKGLLQEIRTLKTIDRIIASDLAATYLSGKISDEDIEILMDNLGLIPNNVDQMKWLIGMSDNKQFSSADGVPPATGEGIGLLSILFTIDTFESIKKCHETLLIDLLVLLLLCEVNDTIIEFMNHIIRKLAVYDLMSDMFNICFSTPGSLSGIEHLRVSAKENSLFWAVSVRRNPHLQQLIQQKDFNTAFDYFASHILLENENENILEIVIELLNRNENEVVLNVFVPKMDETVPLNSFLIGIILLVNGKFERFHEILKDYTLFDRVNHIPTKTILLDHLKGSPSIREFLSGIFIGKSESDVTKSNYFHQLSNLIMRYETWSGIRRPHNSFGADQKQHLLELALDLETTAIQILQSSNDSQGLVNLTSVYLRNHFSIAIDIGDFDKASVSLSKLKSLSSRNDFKNLFTKLIKALIKQNEYRQLFASGSSRIYAENYLLVDSILLELANEDLVLSNALKSYELLYSWRLLGPSPMIVGKTSLVDKRGAAEALYIFITRFRNEKDNLSSDSAQSENFQQFKLKILELYKIIVTILKTFSQEEDKWIRKRGGKKSSSVLTLTELDIEHYRWLKDLEEDFFKNQNEVMN